MRVAEFNALRFRWRDKRQDAFNSYFQFEHGGNVE